MRPKLASLLAALATFATAVPAHAGDDPATTFTNKAGEAVSHTCRSNGQPEDICNQTPVGKHVSRDALTAYATSWTHHAFTLQYELANDVPFANAPWVGTHNSFNSMAYGYTLSRSDSNQQLSLTDQLAIDVRSVELDIHWFNGQPTVCHGAELNAGCTTEGPIGPYLDEIAKFLRDHKDQVLLLYLEDAIGNAQGYDMVTAELARIEREFEIKLYRSAGGCRSLPLTLTRDDVLAAGAQIVAVASGCGGGTLVNGATAWSSMVFDWRNPVHVESRPRDFKDFPDGCGPDFDRATYRDKIVRYFEDSTFLTSAASTVPQFGIASADDGITAATAAAMMRCGVDLTGLDQLLPDDGRLEALVWSWARDEPSATDECAIQRREGAHWEGTSCAGATRPAACLSPDGSWLVTAKAVTSKKAAGACAKQGASFAVPRTGYENAVLGESAVRANAGAVWLGYRRAGSGWVALDGR